MLKSCCVSHPIFSPLIPLIFFSLKGPQGPQGPVGFPGPKGPNVSSCCQTVVKVSTIHNKSMLALFTSAFQILIHPYDLMSWFLWTVYLFTPPGPTRKRWAARSSRTERRDGEWVVLSMNALCRAIWPWTSCISTHSFPTQSFALLDRLYKE